MTLSDLLEVVYRFYPRGLMEASRGYSETEEHVRLREAARRGVEDYPRWKAMMRRLGERYPFWDWSLYLLGGSCGPAYSGFIWIPGYRIAFHVSLLGPYYGIHRLGAPGEEEAAIDIARAIEATYPGYEPIPPELGEVVVPDVVWFDHTTIYQCLLSDQWKSSMPDDVKRSPDYVEPGTEDEAPDPEATDAEPEELITIREVRRDGSSRIYRMRLADHLAELTVEERRNLLRDLS